MAQKHTDARKHIDTLCCLQKKQKPSACRYTPPPPSPLSPPHIPVEEEACLCELLCLLKTFQCGFPTLRVVLVAGEGGFGGGGGGGGEAWGNLSDFVLIGA